MVLVSKATKLIIYMQSSFTCWNPMFVRLFIQILKIGREVRATPYICSECGPQKWKFDEEAPKSAGLAPKTGYGPTYFHTMVRLVKGIEKLDACCWLAR